jgi:hypothetical protein
MFIGILFLVLNLEVLFLFPWAVSLSYIGLKGFIGMSLFLFILTVGFFYEWKLGAFKKSVFVSKPQFLEIVGIISVHGCPKGVEGLSESVAPLNLEPLLDTHVHGMALVAVGFSTVCFGCGMAYWTLNSLSDQALTIKHLKTMELYDSVASLKAGQLVTQERGRFLLKMCKKYPEDKDLFSELKSTKKDFDVKNIFIEQLEKDLDLANFQNLPSTSLLESLGVKFNSLWEALAGLFGY